MAKKKILVLEKDEDILQIIIHILNDEGYEVKGSRSEKGMIDEIKAYAPDAILLDIIQPTALGSELCRTIKLEQGICHIPVIVLSTHSKVDILKDICADEIVKKPFDVSFLVETLEKQFVA